MRKSLRPRRRISRTLAPGYLLLIAGFLPAFADNVQYAYDALGRVIEAVNSSSGQAAEYSYDPAGNITAIKTVATGTPSIAGFSSTQGPAGTQITIYGTGFNTTAGANIVLFNGVVATVVSATSTQLVVIIPNGATTGPVKVTNSSGSASSATVFVPIAVDDDLNFLIPLPSAGAANTNFTVVAVSNTPSISGFTPGLGPAGTAVSVNGANFQPLGQDKVVFNQSSAQLTAAGSTSLTTVVPADASSGNISVTTAYGTAVSSSPFFVVPTGYSASNVATTGILTTGAGTYVPVGSSQIALEVFSGAAGQYLTLAIINNNIPNAALTVYDPNGSQLTTGTVPSSSGTTGFQLPQLPATGSYTIVINPGSNSGSMTIEPLAPISGTLQLGSSPTPLNLSPNGERALLTFSGSSGQYVTLTAGNVALSGGNLMMSIISPAGATLLTYGVNNGVTAALKPQLPMSGTYSALINTANTTSGTMTLQLSATPAPTISSGQSYTANISGSAAQLAGTFNLAAGHTMTLQASEGGGTISGANIWVAYPTGYIATSTGFSPTEDCNSYGSFGCVKTGYYSGSASLTVQSASYSGTYSVYVQATYAQCPGKPTTHCTPATSGPLTFAATGN